VENGKLSAFYTVIETVELPWKTVNVRPFPHAEARQGPNSAFTLVEVLVAVLIIGIVSVSLFACFSQGFGVMEASRENLRATQILLQKMETIRLCTWSQLTNVTFTAYYDPTSTNTSSAGAMYTGTMTTNAATAIPSTNSYYSNMCVVTVALTWTNYTLNRPVGHTRQMQTQVARYGLQNYIWTGQ
jgi:prepilin-type N-terminal cleavage/methylation domain-containing protein